MKAIVFDQFGPPEVLRLVDLPVPEPGEGQLRIRVHAVSVNQALDVGLRQGVAGVPVKLPNTPGIDPSGVVDAVGPGVTGWSVGDRVAASVPPTQGGGYAEFALVAAAAARRVPEGLDFPRATVVNRHFPTEIGRAHV